MSNYWIKKGVGMAFMTLIAIIIYGYVFMWLWNMLVPEIFGLTTINYWQSFGLIFMAKLLFGFNTGKHKGWHQNKEWHLQKHQWKNKIEQKMEGMTEEEKQKFKESMKGWCYGEKAQPSPEE